MFHITVGAHPSGDLDLTHEVRLLKAALLYADKVRFCSLSASILLSSAVEMASMTQEKLLELGATIDPEFRQAINIYNQLAKNKRRTKEELIAYRKIKTLLDEHTDSVRAMADEVITKTDGIISAIESGLVELYPFSGDDIDTLADQFFDVIGESVVSKSSYPLFDDRTGNLVRLAVQEGKLELNASMHTKARHVGLSSELIKRLPVFDTVSVELVLGIRNELQKPLVRFRQAITSFTNEIHSDVWNEEFLMEVDRIFYEHVEPAVLEIEEATKSNSLLLKLVPTLYKEGLSTSSLGVLIGQAADLPQLGCVDV